MGNRILDIDFYENPRGKVYPVTLKDGQRVFVPVRGVVDAVPGGLVLQEWCYRFVMKQKQKQKQEAKA